MVGFLRHAKRTQVATKDRKSAHYSFHVQYTEETVVVL